VGGVKGVDELLRVSKVCSWLPAIVPRIIAFPFDKVLELITILMTIQDVFDFVFEFIIDLNWLWRWRSAPVYFVAPPWGEAVDMEDRVLSHGWWKEQSIGEITSTFCNFVGAQLLWS
jgi:hypothetical protein